MALAPLDANTVAVPESAADAPPPSPPKASKAAALSEAKAKALAANEGLDPSLMGGGGGFGGGGGKGAPSLQKKFSDFRKERQRERKLKQVLAKTDVDRSAPEHKAALRAKFLAQSRKYLDVPYAACYHTEEGDPDKDAPLYLDCCGLTRRCVQDLQADFGFKIGRWNQAYQWETCPTELTEAEMQPGDLVFVEGTYSKEGKKQQRNNIVHVEIWTGETAEADDGTVTHKTIGARHQRGRLCEHDSYKFVSKSYEIQKYHLRSIDEWLGGKCVSETFSDAKAAGDGAALSAPGASSIFDDQQDVDCGNDAEDAAVVADDGRPVFYVGKGNGWRLVADALTNLGWQQLPFEYHFRSAFDLKWVEQRSSIDYSRHTEGQLVNHIPNNTVLSTKLGLLESLRGHFGADGIPEWFPETYRLDEPADALALLKRHEALAAEDAPAPVWICKPAGANCGRGIEIMGTAAKLKAAAFPDTAAAAPEAEGDDGDAAAAAAAPAATKTPSLAFSVAQRYVTNPLLLEGRKFDLRVYALVASTEPHHLWYFHSGYARLSLEQYEAASGDFANTHAHLTNAAVQKTHASYKANKGSHIWSLEKVAEAVAASHGVDPKEWLDKQLLDGIKRVMVKCYRASAGALKAKKGYFDLLGFDFMLDDALNLKLIEVNTNPALSQDSSPVLQDLMPKLVRRTVQAVLAAQPLKKAEASGDDFDAPAADGPETTPTPPALDAGGMELIVDAATGFTFGAE